MNKWKKKTPPPQKQVNNKAIEDMLKALEHAGVDWQQATLPNKQKYPPIMIPSVFTNPPPNNKEAREQAEDFALVDFMQECRERTAHMKDDEKCARCKLRFRCYTEIKIEKKRKTKVRKPIKLGTQPIPRRKILSTVLYSQSMERVITDKTDESIDWLKVVKDVAENTRPDTEKEIKTS